MIFSRYHFENSILIMAFQFCSFLHWSAFWVRISFFFPSETHSLWTPQVLLGVPFTNFALWETLSCQSMTVSDVFSYYATVSSCVWKMPPIVFLVHHTQGQHSCVTSHVSCNVAFETTHLDDISSPCLVFLWKIKQA